LKSSKPCSTYPEAKTRRNRLAARVKLVDIEDNIDVPRLASPDEHDLARIRK
jgi:hypothetical protein